MSEKIVGNVAWISGPVIRADQVCGLSMMEQVEIGQERLIGEVLELDGDTAIIQVYEVRSEFSLALMFMGPIRCFLLNLDRA
jgi:vacuolar-type H+-ATPase catalytic subunit A/Vma1